MLIHSASIGIFDYHKKMDEHLQELHSFLLNNRILETGSYESSFNKKSTKFELLIRNGDYEEYWTLRKKFDTELSLTMTLDVVRKNIEEKFCLKQDIDFISVLLEKKFIDRAYFHLGLPQKKKYFFSSKFHESNSIGFEYALFLSRFRAKYVYNWDLLDKYNEQIKKIIKNYWGEFKQDDKIIKLKRSEFDTFFKNVDTRFSKELMQLVEK